MFSGAGLFFSQALIRQNGGASLREETSHDDDARTASRRGHAAAADRQSTGDELFRMGLLYSTGQGGAPLDYVSAHMLFNLAAMRGSVEAKVYRKELSQEMASDEVAEAQRQAREWLAHG